MKMLEIEKTKPTFIISTFKTGVIIVGLVFSISNFFVAKTSLANNWRSFSSSYLALLVIQDFQTINCFLHLYMCNYKNDDMNTEMSFFGTHFLVHCFFPLSNTVFGTFPAGGIT